MYPMAEERCANLICRFKKLHLRSQSADSRCRVAWTATLLERHITCSRSSLHVRTTHPDVKSVLLAIKNLQRKTQQVLTVQLIGNALEQGGGVVAAFQFKKPPACLDGNASEIIIQVPLGPSDPNRIDHNAVLYCPYSDV